MMNKLYLFCFAVLFLFITACNKDEEILDPGKDNVAATIGFDGGISQSRAAVNAPTLLNNEFFVIGDKVKGTETTTVFNGTKVSYNGGWSYDNTVNWDFDANNYDFIAYSFGLGDTSSDPKTFASVGEGASIDGFTVNGNQAELFSCYFTNKTRVENNAFGNTVILSFNQLAAKLRLEFYENIDGYTIKDMTFEIYTESEVLPNAGPYSVSFDSDNKAVLTHQPKEDNSNLIKELHMKGVESGSEITGIEGSISETATECSSTDDCLVLPMTAPTTKLKIKVKYKSVKKEDSTETEVTKTGVLANSIDWKYQHRYIYRLQITNAGVECVQYKDDEWDSDYRH